RDTARDLSTPGKDSRNKWKMRLHSFENGVDKPRLVWQQVVPDEYDAVWITPIVADCDGDGTNDICIARWDDVVVFDSTTGLEKFRCEYRPGLRPYGYFGCYVDARKGAYLVNVGHKAGHVEALAVRDGKLKLLWYHQYDPGDSLVLRQTIAHAAREPLGDFNGDGRPEILVNTFNDSKDGRWHLLGYDMETGKHNFDLPDVYAWGHADINGDGQEELLTQVCRGRPRGTYGELRIYRGDKVIWSHPHARWSIGSPPYPAANREQVSSEGGQDAAVRARFDRQKSDTIFITVPGKAGETLQALHFHDGKPQVAWSVSVPPDARVQAVAARPDAVLVSVSAETMAQVEVRANDARLEAVAARPFGGTSQPLVLHDAKGRSVVIASDPLGQVTAWRATGQTERPLERLWRRPGRTQGSGMSAADVDRDGVNEMLAVREAPDGHGQLVAYGLDGSDRWSHDFPGFSPGNIDFWTAGHPLDPNRWDLIVTTRRDQDHSQETCVINTKDGSVAWHGDRLLLDRPMADQQVPRLRAFGGAPIGLADYDGDGLDDIVLQAKSEHWIIKGTNGKLLTGIVTWPPNHLALEYPSDYAIWGAPMLVADLDGNGKPESVVAYGWTMVAFKPVPPNHLGVFWHTGFKDGASNAVPAVADVNGDGKLELGVAGCNEGFRCLDAATGKTLWNVPAEGRASNTVGVNIDGDGKEDFVFGRGTRLMAVTQGDDGAGRIVWKLKMPVEISEVAVADWNGDGKADVITCGVDGKLYGVR
ncbi:MAG: VCBS repeat-containing protein, partial [Pirellulales bacterium]